MTEIAIPEAPELAELVQARSILQRSQDLGQIRNIRDVAVAAKRYAEAKKLGAEAERYASVVVIEAERRLGQVLAATPREDRRGAGRPPKLGAAPEPNYEPTPRQQAGKKLSATSQKLAQVPDEVVIEYTEKAKKPTPTGLLKFSKEKEREEIRAQGVEPVTVSGLIRIEHCSLTDLRVEPDSADLIFTDPPYPREFLPLWSDLGALAAKALKPGALLLAYTGQMFLPEVMQRLGEHLDYWWCYAVVHNGAFFQLKVRQTQVGWKPVLAYRKPGGGNLPWTNDIVDSGAREKGDHEWQQSQAEAEYWIGKLTKPGDLVMDPFLGGGTTAAACKSLGRSFLGCDIDAAHVATSRQRVA